jgi:hypothetical protein
MALDFKLNFSRSQTKNTIVATTISAIKILVGLVMSAPNVLERIKINKTVASVNCETLFLPINLIATTPTTKIIKMLKI